MGVLDYLYHNNLLLHLQRTAGTSSGAVAACITCFGLPFEDMKNIAETLDYSKVPGKEEEAAANSLPEEVLRGVGPVLGDFNCIYRLITRYGWFSSQYFYSWIKNVIADQFNTKKKPPYTFKDFKEPSLHKDNRVFLDLYITGTNLSTGTGKIFSYETTPLMEVAQAVRASISIPLFFEALEVSQPDITGNGLSNVFCDGGILNNYPLRLFDSEKFTPALIRGVNMESLGVRFMSKKQTYPINNLLDFIESLVLTSSHVQQEEYYSSPMDRIRSIKIDSLDISPIDFNLNPQENTYKRLYSQGYYAAMNYFTQ